jgi:putative YphP/YqiW family bacilliredoxin
MPPLYDPEAVRFMWEELAHVGIRPVTTPEEVDSTLKSTSGTTLVVVNSVCGCAAGNCRPGVSLSLQNGIIPDNLITVFAGMDKEAVAKAREYFNFAPSSPNVVLFKDGKIVHALERRHIERMTALDIAKNLVEAYNRECSRKGPSVPRETFEKVEHAEQCGSSLPLFQGN